MCCLTLELTRARQLARLLLAKMETAARSATDAARRRVQRFVRRHLRHSQGWCPIEAVVDILRDSRKAQCE